MTFLLLACLLLAGCKTTPPPPPPPPDAGECVPACERLRSLHCPEAEPTPAGVPCEVWLCAYAATTAGVSAGCLHRVASCSEAPGCGR
jgi:hypothetical protein